MEEEEDIKMDASSSPPLSWPSTPSSLPPHTELPVERRSLDDAIEFRNELLDGATVGDVETLLSSVGANVLASGIGDIGDDDGDDEKKVVGLDKLRGKVVGLYFYCEWRVDEEMVFQTLEDMNKELTTQGLENILVVFICLRFDGYRDKIGEETFWKQFKGKPWFASPFSNWHANQKLYAKFCFLSELCYGPRLAIIRPEENIAHTYAWDIFHEYGIKAYPFSKSRVTEIEVARLKSLTLNSVCSTKHNLYDVRGLKVSGSSVNHLLGKNVIFFLTTEPDEYSHGGQQDKLIHNQVSEWYSKMKNELPEEFEMVRVIYNCNQSLRKEFAEKRSNDGNGKKMPWLEFVPRDLHEMEAVYQIFFEAAGDATYDFLPVFVAFGRDGKFKNMTTSLGRFVDDDGEKIDDSCVTTMFFDDSHLVDEVRNYIGRCKSWISQNEETGVRYLAREKMRIALQPYNC